MKILKRPDNIIFDTENPNVMEFNLVTSSLAHPLNEITLKSDWQYLTENFPAIENNLHPVFKDFGESYYYCISI